MIYPKEPWKLSKTTPASFDRIGAMTSESQLLSICSVHFGTNFQQRRNEKCDLTVQSSMHRWHIYIYNYIKLITSYTTTIYLYNIYISLLTHILCREGVAPSSDFCAACYYTWSSRRQSALWQNHHWGMDLLAYHCCCNRKGPNDTTTDGVETRRSIEATL